MIPASTSVVAYDTASGEQLTYDEWVPEHITINSPQDWTGASATPTAAFVVLRRCRTLPSGKTDRLQDIDARRLGVQPTLSLSVSNIYANPSDDYTAEVKGVVLAALSPLIAAIATLGTSRGLL